MMLPRVSMGWLMVGIALLAVPLAFVAGPLRGGSLPTGGPMHDLGLWPGLVAFPAASFALLRRQGKRSPFLWGFAAMGWICLLAYLVCCLAIPQFVQNIIDFYVNDIDCWIDWLIDADSIELYAVNMLVLGLFLATPQLILATVGGLFTQWISGVRWTST